MDNPFLQYVPKTAAAPPQDNPFTQFVPKTSSVAPLKDNPFTQFVPKAVAGPPSAPASPATPPPAPRDGVAGPPVAQQRFNVGRAGKAPANNPNAVNPVADMAASVALSPEQQEQVTRMPGGRLAQAGVATAYELGNVAAKPWEMFSDAASQVIGRTVNKLGGKDPDMVDRDIARAREEVVDPAGAFMMGRGGEAPIKSAAIRTPEGKILTGADHDMIRASNPETKAMPAEAEGFVDTKGQFHTREQALPLAKAAEQVEPDFKGELHSHDLKPAPTLSDAQAWAKKMAAKPSMGDYAPKKAVAPKTAGAAPKVTMDPIDTELRKAFGQQSKPAKTTFSKYDSEYNKFVQDVAETGKNPFLQGLSEAPADRVARAKKLGFNTDLTLYHGTNKEFASFDTGKGAAGEKAVFLTDNPKIADAYKNSEGKQTVPVWAKFDKPWTVDWTIRNKGSSSYSNFTMQKLINEAKAKGYDSIIVKNIGDVGGMQTQYVMLKPENLRAKMGAAFNPKYKNSANMLSASGATTGEILQGTIDDNKKTQFESRPTIMENLRAAGKTIKAIAAPELVDENAGRAAASIRQELGREIQRAEQSKEELQKYQKQVAGMDMQQRLDIIDWVQNPDKAKPGFYEPSPEHMPLLQSIKDVFQRYQDRLEALPTMEKLKFVEDYFPQMWKDPEKARQYFGGSKEGAKGFTRKRTFESYAEGISAGLEPVTTDPIEASMRYVDNAARFIAHEEVYSTAKEEGTLKYFYPGSQPEGWAEVNGRHETQLNPAGGPPKFAYAPEGWARVYNNHISKGIQGEWGNVVGAVRKTFNSISAFKLGLSGYHASMMAQESVVNGVANAVGYAVQGKLGKAGKALLEAPLKPVTSAMQGRRMQKAYLHGTIDPKLQKVIDLAVDANFRVVGKGRVADEYRYSGAGNFITAFKKGSLKAEMLSDLHEARLRPMVGTMKVIAKNLGRALETISDPLFKHYIPMIKNGAFFDNLSAWMDANPEATAEEQVAKAREVANLVDDRMGEVNQDNIFWTKTQKQVAQMSMLSYSYTAGTMKSLAGGAADFAGAPVRAVKGGAKPVWTDKMSYVVALPIVYGSLMAAYQYIKTGKPPEDMQDLLAARTGGKDAASGKPERAALPSYMKEVFGWFEDPRQEALNKLHPAIQTAKGLFTGKDWRGDPLYNSDDTTMQALGKVLDFGIGAWQPITLSNKAKAGSNIGGAERMMGAKPAPMYLTDPKGYESMKATVRLKEDAEKAWHDHTAALHDAGKASDWRNKQAFIARYKQQHRPKQ